MAGKYIVIEGNIGAGKTTLARKIADELGVNPVLEEYAENPFLPDFYKSKGNNAFQLEMSFLITRLRQLSEVFSFQSNKFVIADFHFEKSLLFAGITLNAEELKLYKSFFDHFKQQIPDPDLVIFLHDETANLLKNISKRGRAYEADISSEYLENIGDSYKKLIQNTDSEKLLIINSFSSEIVSENESYNLIVNSIKEKL